MSDKKRRHFTAEKKAQVARRHLAGKVPVSDLADEFGVQPSQIHQWVKQVLDQADKAFERSSGPRRGEQVKGAKIAQLEAKLSTKNEVIAELMEENVKAKKSVGNPERTVGSSRYARRNRRLGPQVERADRTTRQVTGEVDRRRREQVLRLAEALR